MVTIRSKAYVIDMPRALKKEKLYAFYSGLEELKNGRVYDKRYNFKVARFNRPQIFVFSNNFPEFGVMSMDRWEVYTINADKTMTKIDPEQYAIYSEVTKVQHDCSLRRKANTRKSIAEMVNNSNIDINDTTALVEHVHKRQKLCDVGKDLRWQGYSADDPVQQWDPPDCDLVFNL